MSTDDADTRESTISAVAALDEPTRRRLYDYVARRTEPVSRDDAAQALDIPRNTAAFHLERLADEGLLAVTHERRTGRSGPGAGRPTKLYQRSNQQIDLSLPQRRYEFAGQLFAASIEEAAESGDSPRAVLERRAAEWGRDLGNAVRDDSVAGGPQTTLMSTLDKYGFEPVLTAGEILLRNCPFHRLAQQHTELVCGMNLHLLDGVLDGLEVTGLVANLEPMAEYCCVRFRPADQQERSES
ncbi:helix-turn-helix domain-containing protein [Gordonia sp. GONU]|uniref:helix-turn-helix transcriptional regulator n=1 Tax=Gordonia TaxID=2053 RepID=UPI00041EB32D|nr:MULTISPECIES: helix-turn-helix domain-containing protein [Gordonia]MCR8895812.1 helix-turn-helix domain-containing protein [Gordonia sp. GONU]